MAVFRLFPGVLLVVVVELFHVEHLALEGLKMRRLLYVAIQMRL